MLKSPPQIYTVQTEQQPICMNEHEHRNKFQLDVKLSKTPNNLLSTAPLPKTISNDR